MKNGKDATIKKYKILLLFIFLFQLLIMFLYAFYFKFSFKIDHTLFGYYFILSFIFFSVEFGLESKFNEHIIKYKLKNFKITSILYYMFISIFVAIGLHTISIIVPPLLILHYGFASYYSEEVKDAFPMCRYLFSVFCFYTPSFYLLTNYKD